MTLFRHRCNILDNNNDKSPGIRGPGLYSLYHHNEKMLTAASEPRDKSGRSTTLIEVNLT